MKFSDIKEKIDAYFDSVSPMDIVRQFEEMGYEFEPVSTDFVICEVKEGLLKPQPNLIIGGFEDKSKFKEAEVTFFDISCPESEDINSSYDNNTSLSKAA